jgi:hypothetical protein
MQPKGPRVTIEFDTNDTERIAGRLLDPNGASARFDGWLGLASGLERILAPAGGPEAADAERHEIDGQTGAPAARGRLETHVNPSADETPTQPC